MADRDEPVVSFFDDLSFGPIDPPELGVRAEWVEEVLGFSGWEDINPELEVFWAAALAEDLNRIVRVSRRSTSDFCGFLEWLKRNDSRPFDLVDLTNAEVSDTWTQALVQAPPIAAIQSEQCLGEPLWARAVPASSDALAERSALWTKLRWDDAPLRDLTRHGLSSAPLEFFDAEILAGVDEDWMPASRAGGRFMGASWKQDFGAGLVHQTGDIVPFSRLEALEDAGLIELLGEAERRNWKVRRVPT